MKKIDYLLKQYDVKSTQQAKKGILQYITIFKDQLLKKASLMKESQKINNDDLKSAYEMLKHMKNEKNFNKQYKKCINTQQIVFNTNLTKKQIQSQTINYVFMSKQVQTVRLNPIINKNQNPSSEYLLTIKGNLQNDKSLQQ